MERCFLCQNKSVCQNLARSCKKWKSARNSIYSLFARSPSTVIFLLRCLKPLQPKFQRFLRRLSIFCFCHRRQHSNQFADRASPLWHLIYWSWLCKSFSLAKLRSRLFTQQKLFVLNFDIYLHYKLTQFAFHLPWPLIMTSLQKKNWHPG